MQRQNTALQVGPRLVSGGSTRRILVVDDSEDSREMLSMLLEDQGHCVRTACDGLEGLHIAETFGPEIAFLDLRMPRMDGFELCARLRACDQTKEAAIFALSAGHPDGNGVRRIGSGFDAYLTKPVEFDVISGLLRSVSNQLLLDEK